MIVDFDLERGAIAVTEKSFRLDFPDSTLEVNEDGMLVFIGDQADILQAVKKLIINEIDELSAKLTANYTGTEKEGWISMLSEAEAFTQSGNEDDATGLVLGARIRGDTLENRVAAVLTAAQVTGLIPDLASGMRSRSNAMLATAADDPKEIVAVLATLASKGQAILAAAVAGDRDEIIELATTGWGD